MKILYLTDQTYLHGGIEKVLSQKANYLAEVSADEVTIVTYGQQGRQPVYALSPKIKTLDLQVDYQVSKSYFHPTNLSKVPGYLRKLKKLLKSEKPDVIISCNFGPDFYFLPFVCGHIPVIKEFHSSRYFSFHAPSRGKAKWLDKLSSWVEKKYTRLVVLNPDEIKFYLSETVSVIPNPAGFRTAATDCSSKRIMAAGRISPVKNFTDLIEVFSRLSANFPDWELHFWGHDYIGTQEALQNQINALSLGDRIKFMGVTNDLKSEMKNYSIYAMTSETECFPMVLLESLSAGLPVISYDAPTGPCHIVSDGQDGFIVPYKNLDIFTQKLKHMMTDENLIKQMGARGRENMQRFDIDNVMQQWRTMFKKVIGDSLDGE